MISVAFDEGLKSSSLSFGSHILFQDRTVPIRSLLANTDLHIVDALFQSVVE